jgi:predicted regulator of Ras-like GTPase activity (Roadblock/LC7/MglB family)
MSGQSLGWLLDDLVERVPSAQQAVVLSVDGLLMGASKAVSGGLRHMSAIAAGFRAARSAGRHFPGGAVRQPLSG